MIRVITGKAKGKKLLVPEDISQPPTDRIKTSIFDLLHEFLPNAIVLDLFAGSGAMAIEALSRGAQSATLVEFNPKAVSIIKQNLANTSFSEQAQVLPYDCFQFLNREPNQKYSLIFLDPPFPMELPSKTAALSASLKFLAEGGVIVCRFPQKNKLPEIIHHGQNHAELVYQKQFGQSLVGFYRN